MTMREKLARAIWKSFQDTQDNHLRKDDWDSNAGKYLRGNFFAAVDAALDALMKPTQDMLDAGANALGPPRNPRPGQSKNDEPMMVLSAMIRAIKEGK